MAESINIRAAFETWYRRERIDFEEHMLAWFEDHYVNTITQAAWCAWAGAVHFLASRGLVEIAGETVPSQDSSK